MRRIFFDDYGWLRMPWFMAAVFGVAFAIGSLLMLVVCALGFWWASASCDAQWTSFVHRWDILGGCLVQYDGTWFPADALRALLERRP